MSKRMTMALLAVSALAAPAFADSPDLGRPATAEEVAMVDISIAPGGETLPPGSGSVAQGAEVYAAMCMDCHGENGVGGEGLVPLTGGIGSLTSELPLKTVASFWPHPTTVFDYVRRAMPLTAPQSLTNEQVYAVTAFILSVDGIVPEDAVLDAASLPEVKMPNGDGFISWWPEPGR